MKHLLLALALALLPLTAYSEWMYNENIDPMTDEDTSNVMIVDGRNTMIVVRCSGNDRFSIFAGVGRYLGSDQRPVAYRFDSNEPQTSRWSLSTDGAVASINAR